MILNRKPKFTDSFTLLYNDNELQKRYYIEKYSFRHFFFISILFFIMNIVILSLFLHMMLNSKTLEYNIEIILYPAIVSVFILGTWLNLLYFKTKNFIFNIIMSNIYSMCIWITFEGIKIICGKYYNMDSYIYILDSVHFLFRVFWILMFENCFLFNLICLMVHTILYFVFFLKHYENPKNHEVVYLVFFYFLTFASNTLERNTKSYFFGLKNKLLQTQKNMDLMDNVKSGYLVININKGVVESNKSFKKVFLPNLLKNFVYKEEELYDEQETDTSKYEDENYDPFEKDLLKIDKEINIKTALNMVFNINKSVNSHDFDGNLYKEVNKLKQINEVKEDIINSKFYKQFRQSVLLKKANDLKLKRKKTIHNSNTIHMLFNGFLKNIVDQVVEKYKNEPSNINNDVLVVNEIPNNDSISHGNNSQNETEKNKNLFENKDFSENRRKSDISNTNNISNVNVNESIINKSIVRNSIKISNKDVSFQMINSGTGNTKQKRKTIFNFTQKLKERQTNIAEHSFKETIDFFQIIDLICKYDELLSNFQYVTLKSVDISVDNYNPNITDEKLGKKNKSNCDFNCIIMCRYDEENGTIEFLFNEINYNSNLSFMNQNIGSNFYSDLAISNVKNYFTNEVQKEIDNLLLILTYAINWIYKQTIDLKFLSNNVRTLFDLFESRNSIQYGDKTIRFNSKEEKYKFQIDIASYINDLSMIFKEKSSIVYQFLMNSIRFTNKNLKKSIESNDENLPDLIKGIISNTDTILLKNKDISDAFEVKKEIISIDRLCSSINNYTFLNSFEKGLDVKLKINLGGNVSDSIVCDVVKTKSIIFELLKNNIDSINNDKLKSSISHKQLETNSTDIIILIEQNPNRKNLIKFIINQSKNSIGNKNIKVFAPFLNDSSFLDDLKTYISFSGLTLSKLILELVGSNIKNILNNKNEKFILETHFSIKCYDNEEISQKINMYEEEKPIIFSIYDIDNEKSNNKLNLPGISGLGIGMTSIVKENNIQLNNSFLDEINNNIEINKNSDFRIIISDPDSESRIFFKKLIENILPNKKLTFLMVNDCTEALYLLYISKLKETLINLVIFDEECIYLNGTIFKKVISNQLKSVLTTNQDLTKYISLSYYETKENDDNITSLIKPVDFISLKKSIFKLLNI